MVELLSWLTILESTKWENEWVKKKKNRNKKNFSFLFLSLLSLSLLIAFLTHISSILITIVTFAAYTLINDESIEFNSSNVFTALALFNQLTVPLFIFPITIPIIISSLISTRRIERFLSLPEIEKEFEGVKHMARVLSKHDDSLDDDQQQQQQKLEGCDNGHKNQSKVDERKINEKLFQQDTIDVEGGSGGGKKLSEIKINLDANATVATTAIKEENEDDEDEEEELKPKSDSNELDDANDVVILRNKNNRVKLRKQNQLSESARIERNRLRSTTAADKHVKSGSIHRLPSFRVPEGIAICINNAKFSWDGRESSNLLQIEKLSIPLGNRLEIIS